METETQLTASGCVVKANFSLADFTTFRVGGPAEWFVAPKTVEELQASLAWARSEGVSVMFLGAGSNLLISDRGLPGLVICTRYLRQAVFKDGSGLVTAAAGETDGNLSLESG